MRYYYSRKATADASCDLSIFRLKKLGMLSKEESFNKATWMNSRTGKKTSIIVGVYITDDPYVRFVYSVTDREGNKTDYDYEVSLVTTPCNFGGVRYWFGCPLCGRRVGVLYMAPGDTKFYCRHCNNLSYHSRNRCTMAAFGDTSRQIDKLRSEIKRWSYRGRPTRKVRRLQALERKMRILSWSVRAQFEKLKARVLKP